MTGREVNIFLTVVVALIVGTVTVFTVLMLR
jgi:hypothetical protein